MTTTAATPVHDIDYESALLGALLEGADFPEWLEVSDFYRTEHQLIAGACRDLAAADEPVNGLTVTRYLRKKSKLKAAGGASFISSLTAPLPDMANVEHYARAVREDAINREAARLGVRLQHGEAPNTILGPLKILVDRASSTKSTRQFIIEPFSEVASLDIPERESLIHPYLPKSGMAMLYGPKGAGKTFFGLTVVVGVAAGVHVFGWAIPKSQTVVYIDGELDLDDLRKRIAAICRGLNLEDEEVLRVGQNLHILSRDRMASLGIMMGYIKSPEAQATLTQALPTSTALVVFDNLSCLFGGEENDAAGWDDILMFMLGLKHERGITSWFVHHSGKGGDQRGTSRREDNLDTSLRLEPVTKPGELTADNAKFRTVWAKHRGFRLRDAPSIVCELNYNRDQMVAKWKITRTDDIRLDALVEEYGTYKRKHGTAPTVRELHKLMTQRAEDEGQSEFKVCRSTTHNLLVRARDEGLLEEG